jgi:PRTRC genetic system protein E
MNTNFFSSIAAMNITGDLQVTVRKGAAGNLVVSVLLNNEQCGDNVKQLIPPLLLKGTAEQLDNDFFENITKPIEQTSSLLLNMETFLKQSEEAKKQSAMAKEKTGNEKKVLSEKDKKYNEAMKKVDELEKAGKYREAWTKVPDTALFPDHAAIIRKRKSALAAKFSPDLFGVAQTVATVPKAAERYEEESNEETDDEDAAEEYGDDNETYSYEDNANEPLSFINH